MKYYALIVGGGAGTRMGTDIPKQFLMLNEKPVLMHTIQAFYLSAYKPEIIVVLNIDYHQYWEKLCAEHNFNIPHTLVKAGRQRFYSVKNGLTYIKGQAIVAIHDAVRPLVSDSLITECFREAELKGNAVCSVQPSDSVRRQLGESTETINRDEIFLVQTPQTFEIGIIKKAYKQPYRVLFTDDASVVEASGVKINMIPGEKRNLKITFPEDVPIAELFLQKRQ
ncbi:2-C-methyl-D-erythritol 4-phosphate cytidylyltransferase [Flavihumibacter sp. R14]|nr:2-C-methyl-D-erythritol 4-phosphate cytidylyltransferase [Flavihumibacter soli]